MRIWSLHPKYLDSKGLVALWREVLLAKKVLEGNTKGYINHPQLNRFKKVQSPLDAIHQYLFEVHKEALKRNYKFDNSKFSDSFKKTKIAVTSGQVEYEAKHLAEKLKNRDTEKYHYFQKTNSIDVHPIFKVIEGGIEDWEIIYDF